MICLPETVFYGDTYIGLKQALNATGEWFALLIFVREVPG
jgi:hypothetical protein